MAFQYWRQRRIRSRKRISIVALGDAYHGDTLGSVSVGGVERFHAMFRPLLFDVLRVPAPDTYRLPAGVPAESACGALSGGDRAAVGRASRANCGA